MYLLSGMELPYKWLLPSATDLRDVLRSWAAMYWISPNTDYWGPNETIYTVGDVKYSAHDI